MTTFVCDLALPGVTGGMLAEIGERAGSLDVLIYLSGEPIERNFAVSATLDGIAEEIEAELSGPINLVELAMPLLRGERPATIVFVTSAHAVSTSPTVPVHAAAMAGLVPSPGRRGINWRVWRSACWRSYLRSDRSARIAN